VTGKEREARRLAPDRRRPAGGLVTLGRERTRTAIVGLLCRYDRRSGQRPGVSQGNRTVECALLPVDPRRVPVSVRPPPVSLHAPPGPLRDCRTRVDTHTGDDGPDTAAVRPDRTAGEFIGDGHSRDRDRQYRPQRHPGNRGRLRRWRGRFSGAIAVPGSRDRNRNRGRNCGRSHGRTRGGRHGNAGGHCRTGRERTRRPRRAGGGCQRTDRDCRRGGERDRTGRFPREGHRFRSQESAPGRKAPHAAPRRRQRRRRPPGGGRRTGCARRNGSRGGRAPRGRAP